MTHWTRQTNSKVSVGVLSERQRAVVGLVAQGMSNKAISEHMFITKKSVENLLNMIYSKVFSNHDTDIDRRVSLVNWYWVQRYQWDAMESANW